MIRQIKRIANSYKLLWLDDRVSRLEERLSAEVAARDNRIAYLADQLDLLKSSLEVSPELVSEFAEWKAQTKLPVQPLVSVCLGTYNRSKLLTERCIPSILSQSYKNLELIIVGDGCTDDTPEAVAAIKDCRLKFVNLPERGVYPSDPKRRWMVAGTQSINHALALAKGDFVTHLDDDDEYMPDRLEKLVRFATENKCDLVWHPFWYETEDGNWQLNEALEFAYLQVTTSSVFYRSWFKKIEWNINAHALMEPGDWNRFRRIKYISPTAMRCPDSLLRHYRERTQNPH